jgi:hypothetical protein
MSPPGNEPTGRDGDATERVVLIIDANLSSTLRHARAEVVAGRADRARPPVTLAAIPTWCLNALRPILTRQR